MKYILEKTTVLRFVVLKIIVFSALIFAITGCQMSEEELNAIVDQRLVENKIDERLRLVENCLTNTVSVHRNVLYGTPDNDFYLRRTPKVERDDFFKGADHMSYMDCTQLYDWVFTRDDRVFSDLPDRRYQDYRCEEVGGRLSIKPDPAGGAPSRRWIQGTLHCGPHNSDREEE